MDPSKNDEPFMAWYRVPEVWLILFLLGASVTGTFVLLGEAILKPDVHLTVPNDVPRPSRIPPFNPATSLPSTTTKGSATPS